MKLASDMTFKELIQARTHAEAMLEDERRRRGSSSLRSDQEAIRERADDLYIIASEIDRRISLNREACNSNALHDIGDAAMAFALILSVPAGLNILAYGFGG